LSAASFSSWAEPQKILGTYSQHHSASFATQQGGFKCKAKGETMAVTGSNAMRRPHLGGNWETCGRQLRDYWGTASGRQGTASGRQLGVVGGKWKTVGRPHLEQTGTPLGRQSEDHICKTTGDY